MTNKNNILSATNISRRKTAKNLWLLSYPTMIAIGLQTAYDIIDMMWIGTYSKAGLSGITLFSTIYMIFSVLNEIAGSSSVSMISQSYGQADLQQTSRIIEQTISFKIVLAILSGILLAIFLKPLLHYYTNDEEVIQATLHYGQIRIFFLPVMFSSYSVNTIFRCTGDAKTPMHIMLVAFFCNVILDPILIFDIIPGTHIRGAHLGVFGAGLATVIASSISFLYGFILLYRGKAAVQISLRGLFQLDKQIDFDLLRIGLPSGINIALRQLFFALMMKFVSLYGNTAISLAGIGSKLALVAMTPLFGFSMGGATTVGYNLGQKNIAAAKQVTETSVILSFLIVSCGTLIAWIFPETIITFFLQDTESIFLGKTMIRILTISFLFMAISIGLSVAFSGSGHNFPRLASSIIARWLVQLPFFFTVK